MAVWLRAQVEADKAAAVLAAREGSEWKQDDPQRYPGQISSLGGMVVYDEGAPDEHQAAHIAIHDPRDVIADCDAKLEILAEYETARVMYESARARGGRIAPGVMSGAMTLRRVLDLLASGYRHRDGWQEGWAA
jgi:Family of unknown function (DUF6221)